MELSKALSRVRKLIERAEHPGTPKPEADSCRKAADEIMEKYAIQEWQALQAGGGRDVKPGQIKIDIGAGDSPFLTELATLANIVAEYCRCRSVWMTGSGLGEAQRQEYVRVYGYEGDLRYFELLFTTLHLHMTGAIFPAPDPAMSLEDNVYFLHNEAGMNWFDIAKAYGWREVEHRPGDPARYMYVNDQNGSGRTPWSQSIGPIKKAYQTAIKARNEEPLRVPPGAGNRYRRNAAYGYLAQIKQRLTARAGQREAGTTMVLRDRDHNIDEMISASHGELSKSRAKSFRYQPEAYGRGVKHAKTAALDPEDSEKTSKPIH